MTPLWSHYGQPRETPCSLAFKSLEYTTPSTANKSICKHSEYFVITILVRRLVAFILSPPHQPFPVRPMLPSSDRQRSSADRRVGIMPFVRAFSYVLADAELRGHVQSFPCCGHEDQGEVGYSPLLSGISYVAGCRVKLPRSPQQHHARVVLQQVTLREHIHTLFAPSGAAAQLPGPAKPSLLRTCTLECCKVMPSSVVLSIAIFVQIYSC